jgi:hypothetical protein
MLGEVLFVGFCIAIAVRAVRRFVPAGGMPTRQLAEACGLQGIAVDSRGAVLARDGALVVRIATADQDGRRGPWMEIEGLGREVLLDRADVATRLFEALGGRDVEVGDPSFDADVMLQGGSSVRAFFDAETRAIVRDVFTAGFAVRVAHGALSASFAPQVARRSYFTPDTLRTLLQLAHRLEPQADPASRLEQIARGDPLSAVRTAALRMLMEDMGDRTETGRAVRAATRDPDPAIRLMAARALGTEGEPILRELVVDPLQSDAIAEASLAALGPRLTIATARGVLVRADSARVRSGGAALRLVAQGGEPEVPLVADLLMRVQGALAIAAIEALATIGGPAVEAPLVEALRPAEPAVAAAAARALARRGSVGAVAALRDAERRGGEVAGPARTAIAAIQARLPGASPGQVSLADGDAGRISIASATDGSVSLPPDEPPR